jgi:hypothetical protein
MQKNQGKPESIDSFAEYLAKKKDAAVQFEMAQAIFSFDTASEKGAEVLADAIKNGFKETEKIDALLSTTALEDAEKEKITALLTP